MKRNCIFCLIVLCSFIFINVEISYSDIYFYRDANGVIHFTNTPTSSKFKLYIKEKRKFSFKYSPYSSKDFDHFITEASKKHKISFHLLKAIIKVESDFNPRAVSKAGAMGLMQIMPDNFQFLSLKNPFDPKENILAGATYFKGLYERYNGELELSLAAYNAGPGAVDKYNRIPPYEETKNYVHKVMKYYETYSSSNISAKK
ncbi:MAG: lytic transglycosylase domain-containing protein [Desulfobacterales bacterium]|nr:lytic transglycosylase domain-containing protein [Desulfobacterales bacterium]